MSFSQRLVDYARETQVKYRRQYATARLPPPLPPMQPPPGDDVALLGGELIIAAALERCLPLIALRRQRALTGGPRGGGVLLHCMCK